MPSPSDLDNVVTPSVFAALILVPRCSIYWAASYISNLWVMLNCAPAPPCADALQLSVKFEASLLPVNFRYSQPCPARICGLRQGLLLFCQVIHYAPADMGINTPVIITKIGIQMSAKPLGINPVRKLYSELSSGAKRCSLPLPIIYQRDAVEGA